jgi:signal peptidase I
MQNPDEVKIAPLVEEVTPKKYSFWGELITFLIIAVFIVLPFRYFIAEPYIVDGTSMSPTFSTGNYLIVDKISWKLHSPSRYDVVVMLFPDPDPKNPTKDFIKRIIGLPGETVQITHGAVTIINAENPKGILLDQSFVKYPKDDTMTLTLKDDEYFVMGDNRAGSYDSRYWGPLPKKDIIGHPILRLLPVSKIGFIPGGFTPTTVQK